MVLIHKEDTNMWRKIGSDDNENTVIVHNLVERTIEHLRSAITINRVTSTELKEQLKSHFDAALKEYFEFRDDPRQFDKFKFVLIAELKTAFKDFCLDFTNKCSAYLAEAGLTFRSQVDSRINSKCLPREDLDSILRDIKAKVIAQYEGSTVPDLEQLNVRLDEEIQFFTFENNKRLREMDNKYDSILVALLQRYEYIVEMRLPDEDLETASEQKLESTFNLCKIEVLLELEEKMQFNVPELKTMFENRIIAVLGERFSQKILASKSRKETKITEAGCVVSNAVESFAKLMSEVFVKVINDTEVNEIRTSKMNELIMSITDRIYEILPERKDAKQMLELAKQRMETVIQDLHNERHTQTKIFQEQWDAELNSICDTFNKQFNELCQSEVLLEMEELRNERDIVISELIRKSNWLNAYSRTDLLESFKSTAKQQMQTLSEPIMDRHYKILANNYEQQKIQMNECLEAYQTKMKELSNEELNEEVYVKAKTLGNVMLEQFQRQVANISPMSRGATTILSSDLEKAISRSQNQFMQKIEDRKLTLNAEVNQLVADVVDDYKQLIDAFSIASNFAKEKIVQIHNSLKTRAQHILQKDLKLAKYTGDLTVHQRKIDTLIESTYTHTLAAIDNQRAEWNQKLQSCDQKANIEYKKLFNSNLGNAANDEDLQKLHEDLKEQAIASWEDSFPIQYFGDKLLPERRKFAMQLDSEFQANISPMWHQINLNIDRNTRNAVEKFVEKYAEEMNSALSAWDYSSDEIISQKHSQFSKDAMKGLNKVDKPKNIAKNVYDDLLSSRLDNTLDCIRKQNAQKKEAIQRSVSDEFIRLRDVLKREFTEQKMLPDISQLFDANRERAQNVANKYKLSKDFKQELVSCAEEKLRDTLNELKSEWDSIQPDPNILQLAINTAVNDYNKEMENRISKTGQIFMSKAMKKHHEHSMKIVQKKFQDTVKQTTAAQEQFNKAIEEVLKKFEDHNDLKAAEYSEAAVGIDLGTTFSCVAIYKGDKIEMIPDREHHSNTVPSYVYYESAEKTVVGHSAKDQSVIYPQTTIFDSKRLIGRKFKDHQIQKDITQWPFKVVQDPSRKEPKIKIHGRTFHPEEISAEILKHLKANAELHLGRVVKDVVITVPAYFNDAQKRATKNAAAFANINVLEIINEPTSAAIAYSLNYTDGKNKNILVFDLGGGTFDVSVLSTEQCNIKVKAVGGDNHLGGEDFDSNLVDFCIEKFRQETGIVIPKNVSSSFPVVAVKDGNEEVEEEETRKVFETLRRLRQKCEQAKINLSKTDKVRVVVDYIYNMRNLDVEITVKDFNQMNMQLFNKCIQVVKDTVTASKLSKEQIDDVVLVGGSSRIPEVQRLLTEFFDGKSLIMTLNPDEVVAQGAAYRAAMISGSNSRELAAIQFQDVNPLSLGIEVVGQRFSIILPKNTPLPAKRTRTYYTTRDYQTSIKVSIYEGEDEAEIVNNNLLGEFRLSNIPSKRKGEEPVDVTIECDDEGLIHVTAKVRSNSSSDDIKIQSNRGGLTEEDIKSAMSRNAT